MKGKYEVIVQNARLQYKFTIERNITILRGDSATGKTTLIDMIAAYQQNGVSSGVTIHCDKPCVVLTALYWQETLGHIRDSIVFIDEGDPFIKSKNFAKAIQNTNNYYVIATRATLPMLPYSVEEVYGIKNTTSSRYQGTKRLYSSFYPLNKTDLRTISKPDCVIVEDSGSGYEFFRTVCKEHGISCISANGKSNMYQTIIDADAETILMIADGAAFGPELEKVLNLKRIKNLIIYLPESFEWLILKSGMIQGVSTILDVPHEHIESAEYFSWEQFFTALLQERTNGTYQQYSKQQLNPVYLNGTEKSKILAVMPEIKWK